MADKQAIQIAPPWQHLPEIKPFIDKCIDKWDALPLSIAGWRFDLAECSTSGNDGLLRTSYKELSGVTVGTSAHGYEKYSGGTTTATFVLPEGSAGDFLFLSVLTFHLIQLPRTHCHRQQIFRNA